MPINRWIRQGHRWMSIAFTLAVAGIFTALGLGQAPAEWVYLTPLAPLALLTISGLYLFALPHVVRFRHRGGEPTR